jgi:NhaP-type Na+/H+ or K+/H+ antiporter/Trk K+ transport system NAD-binding subunit
MSQHLAVNLGLIVALGIAAQWLAWRVRIPAIILLVAAGLAIGPVLGWVQPSRDFGNILHALVALSVAVILFEGGLNLRWHEYRETGIDVIRLVSIGLLMTWTLGSASAHYIAHLSWPIAVIFGAIIVVTGPTVITPLLKQAKLQRRPAALLKWEGIINDPVGALLAVLVFEYFSASEHTPILVDVLGDLGMSLAFAVIVGAAVAYLLSWSFLRGLVPEYLKAPVMLATILILYVSLNRFQDEAGLLGVTAAGVVLANRHLRNIDELRRFKEYITVILVSVVFILLTADIDPGVLAHLDGRSAALLAAIIFVVRPIAVYAATLGSHMDWRERLLVAWVAPRGIVAAAVAGLFAPRLIEKGYGGAEQLLPLVFALIVTTVVVHGLSIGWLARRLKLAAQRANGLLIVGASPWSVELAHTLQDLKVPTILSDTSWNHLHGARMAGVRQTHHGEILSERSEETLELNEISHLLAATANDAYNALVCTRFAPEIGRNQVYQLPSMHKEENGIKEVARTLRGRIAFDEDTRYEDFMRYHYEGWEFHSTQLSDEYSFKDFTNDLPRSSILISSVSEKGELILFPLQDNTQIQASDTLISYRPPVQTAGDHAAKSYSPR